MIISLIKRRGEAEVIIEASLFPPIFTLPVKQNKNNGQNNKHLRTATAYWQIW